MSKPLSIDDVLALAPVIPVLTVEGPADAVPLARALVAGGLRALEFTLRTAGALEAIRAVAAEVEGAVPGVGTVARPQELRDAAKAGARFAVSPGHTAALLAAARGMAMPYLPGVQTVSEAMALAEQGWTRLKFFPAEPAGGLAWLKAVAAPLPGLKFCPTGGIDAVKAPAYLALPTVPVVGGSWVAPADKVKSGDWAGIAALARAAASLRA
jgi:2-dehydro-3-deoxyphosphogluconate aldolase/(4S)-4-hydroxy-2-oxoglutarate aldolase